MRQKSFSEAEYRSKGRQTRKEKFLDTMEQVIPWSRLETLLQPHYPKAGNGRRPIDLSTMLRIYFMQQWFGMSDPGMEDGLYEITAMRIFAGVSIDQIPDESTILRFRHLLEKHQLTKALFEEVKSYLSDSGLCYKQGTMIDATIIAAPESTKNKARQRDPQMHQTRKGNQWYFGMKAHVGSDAQYGIVHSLSCTAANVHDICEADKLLHGKEEDVWADAGYTGVEKREEHEDREVNWLVAMKRGKRKKLKEATDQTSQMLEDIEKIKSQVRARVEHVFRIVKVQFGYRKVRYKGLEKNTAQLYSLFMLANIYQTRHHLLT